MIYFSGGVEGIESGVIYMKALCLTDVENPVATRCEIARTGDGRFRGGGGGVALGLDATLGC